MNVAVSGTKPTHTQIKIQARKKHSVRERTDKLTPMREPKRACAPQRKYAHTRVVRARVHQHIHIEPLEQRVVVVIRRGIAERDERRFECRVACAGVRDEGHEDGQDLL